jgi:hypothetical protein
MSVICRYAAAATAFYELLDEDSDDFPLIEPENDKEIRPVQVLKSTILTYKPVSERFTHHSSWNRLVNAFTVLRDRTILLDRESSFEIVSFTLEILLLSLF